MTENVAALYRNFDVQELKERSTPRSHRSSASSCSSMRTRIQALLRHSRSTRAWRSSSTRSTRTSTTQRLRTRTFARSPVSSARSRSFRCRSLLHAQAWKELSLSDKLVLTHRDELQKLTARGRRSGRRRASPTRASSSRSRRSTALRRVCEEPTGLSGFFVQFIIEAVSVDAQLPQEECQQRQFIEHLANVYSA